MKTIKKVTPFFILSLIILGICKISVACSKDSSSNPYTCISCHTAPDALAENDGSAKGVYKGVVVGSTGTIAVNIQNGSSTVTATMVLDGTTIALTSSIIPAVGQSYLSPFTGTYNGSTISITFSVAADGSNPTVVTSSIPGHPNATFQIVKETSTSLIEAFEGTYSLPGETGVFNIVLSSGLGGYSGIAKDNASADVSEVDGTYSNGQLIDSDGTVVGTITGDVLSGTFQDSNGTTITISGHRTL